MPFWCQIQDKLLSRLMLRSLHHIFSSRPFVLLGSYIKAFSPFCANFYVWYNMVVCFHSLACSRQVFPTLLKRLSFFHWMFLALWCKLIYRVCVNFWTVSFIPLTSVSIFVSIPSCSDYYNFLIYLEIREQDTPGVLLSQDYFDYLCF